MAGVHFLKAMPAESIAYRSVATALSDIAAMGGNPVAFNLSLVMPEFNPDWMQAFKKGLQKISKEFQLPLIGGDLVKGPMQISVTVLGKPEKKILLRSNAQPWGYIMFIWRSGLWLHRVKRIQAKWRAKQ